MSRPYLTAAVILAIDDDGAVAAAVAVAAVVVTVAAADAIHISIPVAFLVAVTVVAAPTCGETRINNKLLERLKLLTCSTMGLLQVLIIELLRRLMTDVFHFGLSTLNDRLGLRPGWGLVQVIDLLLGAMGLVVFCALIRLLQAFMLTDDRLMLRDVVVILMAVEVVLSDGDGGIELVRVAMVVLVVMMVLMVMVLCQIMVVVVVLVVRIVRGLCQLMRVVMLVVAVLVLVVLVLVVRIVRGLCQLMLAVMLLLGVVVVLVVVMVRELWQLVLAAMVLLVTVVLVVVLVVVVLVLVLVVLVVAVLVALVLVVVQIILTWLLTWNMVVLVTGTQTGVLVLFSVGALVVAQFAFMTRVWDAIAMVLFGMELASWPSRGLVLHMFLGALIAELVQDAAPFAVLRLSFGVIMWIPVVILLLHLLATVAASAELKGVVAPTGDNVGPTFTAAAMTLHRRMR